MAPWSIIIDALQYFGITPDKFGPFFLFSLVVIWYLSYKLSPMNRSLKRIGNAMIEVQTFLKGQGMRIDHTLIESPGSPLGPTAYGVQLIRESGLEKIMDEHKNFFVEKLRKILPSHYSEYDVQEQAIEVLKTSLTEPFMKPVKDYAYQNATDVLLILRAARLWLRDDFLGQSRMVGKEDNDE